MYRIRPLSAVGMDSSAATRAALIAAATPLFARQGYEATRTREIADKAKANVSAINYHFGSKMGLYQAVIRQQSDALHADYPLDPARAGADEPEARLRWVIRNMVSRIAGKHADDRLRICLREFVEPTEALDTEIREIAAQQWAHIGQAVAAVLPRPLGEDELQRHVTSVVAQVYYYGLAGPMLKRLGIPVPESADDIESLADHITRFSLGGLRATAAPAGAA